MRWHSCSIAAPSELAKTDLIEWSEYAKSQTLTFSSSDLPNLESSRTPLIFSSNESASHFNLPEARALPETASEAFNAAGKCLEEWTARAILKAFSAAAVTDFPPKTLVEAKPHESLYKTRTPTPESRASTHFFTWPSSVENSVPASVTSRASQ